LLALAAPGRLRIFDTLRREGPLSPAAMAAALGEDRTAVAAALAEFEACGLAFAEDGQWRAAGRGFVFEMPDDPQGQEAARQLANAVLLQYVDLPNPGWRTTSRGFRSTGFAPRAPSMRA
jgi:hypothetical protein